MDKKKDEVKKQPLPLMKKPIEQLIKEAKEKRDKGESPWFNRKVDN